MNSIINPNYLQDVTVMIHELNNFLGKEDSRVKLPVICAGQLNHYSGHVRVYRECLEQIGIKDGYDEYLPLVQGKEVTIVRFDKYMSSQVMPVLGNGEDEYQYSKTHIEQDSTMRSQIAANILSSIAGKIESGEVDLRGFAYSTSENGVQEITIKIKECL